MAQTDMLRRYLDAGIAFTKMTQERAEAIVRDLVGAGEVGADQASTAVQDIVERSRENTERLLETVRAEINAQIGNLGLATRDDVEALRAEIAALRTSGAGAPSSPQPPAGGASPAGSEPSKAAPAKAGPSKAGPSKAGPSKAAPSKAAPTKAAPTKRAAAAKATGEAVKLPATKAPASKKAAGKAAPRATSAPTKKAAAAKATDKAAPRKAAGAKKA